MKKGRNKRIVVDTPLVEGESCWYWVCQHVPREGIVTGVDIRGGDIYGFWIDGNIFVKKGKVWRTEGEMMEGKKKLWSKKAWLLLKRYEKGKMSFLRESDVEWLKRETLS